MLKLTNFSVQDILQNINVQFDEGKTYVIMGKNGVGKSTLIHSIMGRPDLETEGSIEFLDQDISELSVDERARLGIFVSFQTPVSIPGLSNFQFIKQSLDIKMPEMKAKLDNFKTLSSQMNLPEDWDKRNLNTDASGGEKKKNELIQLLMLDKKFAMLDEPDSGLDVDGIKTLVEQLNNWKNKNNTLVVVTHYEQLIQGLNPDTVIVLQKNTVKVGDKSLAEQIFNNGFDNV